MGKCIECYVTDEPEGKFLYKEIIKSYCNLYCIVLYLQKNK